MEVETNGQYDSEEQTLSDGEDKITSYNEELLRFVRQQSIIEIEMALSNKLARVNYQNVNGDTALHLAVRMKNPNIVDLLIKQGFDVDLSNKLQKTPLQMVRERLEEKPNSTALQSIEAILRRAQAGPSARNESPMNDSQMSEIPLKKRKMDPTEPGGGVRPNFHGPIYQTKLLALFVKRALRKKYRFSLLSEVNDAGTLDDIVFGYEEMDANVSLERFRRQ